MANNKPILSIGAKLDAQASKKQIQSQLDKLGGQLKLTIGVDKSGLTDVYKNIKDVDKRIKESDKAHAMALIHNGKLEQQNMAKAQAEAIKMNREFDKGLKLREQALQYEQKTRKAMEATANRQKGIMYDLKKDFLKFSEFYFVGGILVNFLNQISSAVSTIYELDNALNQIRIVTGKTQEEVVGLTKEYNEFAMANSVTTLEVAKLSTELYRQGLAQDEVADRMQAIIKYSKISGLSVEEAGEIITAAANGTKKDVNEIIDVFSNLGDMTAAGADEIGLAMQRVAGSAQTAGIPFEQLAAQISTVSSVTRESASTIGQSFKSLLARYGQIKEQGFNEEDSENINSVAKALKTVGINATDTSGQLRPFGEVIDELGSKWVTLDSNTQKYLATTLGGTYQANRLLVLLNNYPEALKNTELAYNSAGNATDKFAIYQESAEAKVAKFKSTLENLFINTLNSDAIKTVLDLGTSTVELTNHIGILNIAVTALITKLGSMALASSLGVQSLKGVALAVAGVNIPITILIASLGALVVGINAYQLAQEKANQETLNASDVYIDSKRKSDELVKSYEELASKTSLTQVEFDKLQKTKQDLLKIYPSLFDNLGKEADNYVNVTNKVRELDAAQRNQVLNQLQGMKAIADAKIAEYKASKKMVEEKGLTEVGKREASQFTAYDVEVAKLEKQQHEAYTKIQDIYKSSLDVIDFTPEKATSGTISGIKTPSKDKSKTKKEDILDNFRQQITLIKELTSATSIYQSKADILEGDAKIKALDKVTNGYKLQQKAVSSYSDAIRKYITTHDISAEDMEKLQDILRSNGEEWWNLEKSIKSVKDTQKDYNDNVAKETAELAKKNAEAIEKMADEAIGLYNALAKSIEDSWEDELDSFKRVKDEEVKIVEQQLTDLENAYNEFERSLESSDLQQQISDLIKEKSMLEVEGSLDANRRIYDIDQELVELRKEQDKQARKTAFENTKKTLEDRKRAIEEEVRREEQYYRTRLDNAENFSSAKVMIENKTMDNIIDLMSKYDSKFKEDAIKKGKTWADEFKAQVSSASDVFNGVGGTGTVGGVPQPSTPPNDYSSGSPYKLYVPGENNIYPVEIKNGTATLYGQVIKNEEKFVGSYVKTAGGYYKVTGVGQAEKVDNPNIQGFSDGGIMSDTDIAQLHGTKARPELILNSGQISNLASSMGFNGSIPNMANNLYNFSNMRPSGAQSSGGATFNNIFNVSAVINNDQDVSNLSKSLAKNFNQEIAKRGVRLNNI